MARLRSPGGGIQWVPIPGTPSLHQLKPVITKGAETMNTIFNRQNHAKSA